MPTRISLKPSAKQSLQREHLQQAARLREYAASTTTPRLKQRLLEGAAEQERLAAEVDAGRLNPLTGARRTGVVGRPRVSHPVDEFPRMQG